MRGWRGVLSAILGLSIVYVLTGDQAAGRVGGLFGDVSRLIANGMTRVSDPKIAGLRNFAAKGTAPSQEVAGLDSTEKHHVVAPQSPQRLPSVPGGQRGA